MRLTGYCEECRRIRPVRVSSAGMARLAMKQVPVGICSSCEDDRDRKRRRDHDG